jgi:dTDP-4-dehydrorhamnose 3,5-epimerase-like enzyme
MAPESPQNIEKANVSGVLLIERPTFPDNRGFFHEIYRRSELGEITGKDFVPVTEQAVVMLPESELELRDGNRIVYPVSGELTLAISSDQPGQEGITLEFNSSEKAPSKAAYLPDGTQIRVRNKGSQPAKIIVLSDKAERETPDLSIEETEIPGLYTVESRAVEKDGVYIYPILDNQLLEKITGKRFETVQWSHSYSLKDVIRAFHSEGWPKLVLPFTGKGRYVIADVRPDSPTFLKKIVFDINNEEAGSPVKALFLPAGIGNSIAVIGEMPVNYIYGVTEYWDNSKAFGFSPTDPDIDADFGIENPVISDRDKGAPPLRKIYPDKF